MTISISIIQYTRMQKTTTTKQEKYICPLPLKIYSLDVRKPVFSICE